VANRLDLSEKRGGDGDGGGGGGGEKGEGGGGGGGGGHGVGKKGWGGGDVALSDEFKGGLILSSLELGGRGLKLGKGDVRGSSASRGLEMDAIRNMWGRKVLHQGFEMEIEKGDGRVSLL